MSLDARFSPELSPELGHPGNLARWETDSSPVAIYILSQWKIESCIIDEISTSLNRTCRDKLLLIILYFLSWERKKAPGANA